MILNEKSGSVPDVVSLAYPSPAKEKKKMNVCAMRSITARYANVYVWDWNIPVRSAVSAGLVRSVSSVAVVCCWLHEPSLWPPACLLPGPVARSEMRSPAGSRPPSHETVSPAEQPRHRKHDCQKRTCPHRLVTRSSRCSLTYLECVLMLLEDVEVCVLVMDVDHVALAFGFS